MERIVVTGSTGFIGKKLVQELIRRRFDVICYSRDFSPVTCDRIYHLASPSTTEKINADTSGVMDVILDKTREALNICPEAYFINASTKGVEDIEFDRQGGYNVAKLCMEMYIQFKGIKHLNYRIPSVYGEGMHDDNFIKRCVDGRAFYPHTPEKMHYISHVDDVVECLIDMKPLNIEAITLGQIYEQFGIGRRRIHRPTPIT